MQVIKDGDQTYQLKVESCQPETKEGPGIGFMG